jgi:hypothetical protein
VLNFNYYLLPTIALLQSIPYMTVINNKPYDSTSIFATGSTRDPDHFHVTQKTSIRNSNLEFLNSDFNINNTLKYIFMPQSI